MSGLSYSLNVVATDEEGLCCSRLRNQVELLLQAAIRGGLGWGQEDTGRKDGITENRERGPSGKRELAFSVKVDFS